MFDCQTTMLVDASGQIREVGIDLESVPVPMPVGSLEIGAGSNRTSFDTWARLSIASEGAEFGSARKLLADGPEIEVDRMTHYGERISQWFADIGLDPDDNEQTRLQKRLLVFSSVMIAAAGLAWGIVYFALGEPTGALIPTSYSILSAISITTFRWLRRYRLFRTSQLALTLILPFALSLALGGLASSSGVILWSLTSPLGALVFAGQQSARRWFVAFLAAVASSALLEPLISRESNMSSIAVTMFLVMNIVGVSTIAFVLLQYFTSQRETAFDLLSTEQETSEALLLNIRPNRSPTGSDMEQPPSPTTTKGRAFCLPTWSTSPRCRQACHR